MPPDRSRSLVLRIAVSVLLLATAGYCTWQTIEGLAERRRLRFELAEISHARYGLLNADKWVAVLGPILESKVDTMVFNTTSAAEMKPLIESAIYRLLDQVKAQMSAPPKPATPPAGGSAPAPAAGGFLATGNAFIVNMIVGALKPHVPEYATVVMQELGKPEAHEALKRQILTGLAEGAKQTFGDIDMSTYKSILQEHGCADGTACKEKIGGLIHDYDRRIAQLYLTVLGASAAAFLLLMLGWKRLPAAAAVVLLLFCVALLVGGVLTPMLEVEARITSVKLTFLGEPVSFTDQVLYFQSKSVLEVFHTLITLGQPEMWVVGVLVLLFSVVFPTLKLIASSCYLYAPGALARNRIVRFFALESSKWSMADVMALAIFMAYVAFNGVIANTLGTLTGGGPNLTIPTDSSKILPGYYLFIGYCLASLFLSRKLGKGIAARDAAPTSPDLPATADIQSPA